jgi:hypothetical protein
MAVPAQGESFTAKSWAVHSVPIDKPCAIVPVLGLNELVHHDSIRIQMPVARLFEFLPRQWLQVPHV